MSLGSLILVLVSYAFEDLKVFKGLETEESFREVNTGCAKHAIQRY